MLSHSIKRYSTVMLADAMDSTDQEVAGTKRRAAGGDDGQGDNQAVSEDGIKSGFDFQCSNNEVGFKWMVGFPNTEVGQYAVEVSGVRDEAGNAAAPLTFVMDANCASSQKLSLARFGLGAKKRST